MDNSALLFFNDPIEQEAVGDQISALDDAAKRLVRNSTIKGAMMGAALGCGLSVVSAGNAKNCLATAALAGAGGAVIGNAAGKQEVSRRIALVSPRPILRDIRRARNQHQQIKLDLPQLLARQESELNALSLKMAAGQISRADHDLAVARINQERTALAEALLLSAKEMRQASRNLEQAAGRGQAGLDWHIAATADLADDIASSRSEITLF